MSLNSIFINPQTKFLRSGWRALIFAALSPQVLFLLFQKRGQNVPVFDVSIAMIVTYMVLVGWVVLISWLCLKFLDRLNLTSLGYAFYRGWWRDLLLGCGIGALMIIVVVGLQALGGGTRIMPNPLWWGSEAIDYSGLVTIAKETLTGLVLLSLAAAFEELLYRGYPFQTLLRGAPAVVPILLFSLLFGIVHWGNPNRTLFTTANTTLAGIWLAIAYLKTRSLWFPTALHLSWNWMMGAFFGLPVSGLLIPNHPILLSRSEGTIWLTGGSYGCEGGLAATIVLIIATIIIWRAKWLSVSPEMQTALTGSPKRVLGVGY